LKNKTTALICWEERISPKDPEGEALKKMCNFGQTGCEVLLMLIGLMKRW